jgi:hypothetical protein
MSRTSLTDQLVDLRRAYTGENLSQAVPEIKAALRTFSADERDDVVDALRGRSPLAERLGTALLPEALTAAQRDLEAALVKVASDAAAHLQLRPPASMLRPSHAFRAVEPHAVPRLHLAEHALGPLLFELLPRLQDGWVAGVPGIRTRRFARSVEVYPVDQAEARVVLAGVDTAAWEEGLRYVRQLTTDRGLSGQFAAGDLTGPEREHLAEHGRSAGPVLLGSALLRRSHLFARAPWVRSWSQGSQWWLEWPAGLGVVWVTDRLAHPVFGLPGAVETPSSAGGLGLAVGPDSLYLREVEPPNPDHEEALGAYDWPAGVTGWR